MQKTKIEWIDYTLNPIKGLCPVDCKDNQGKSYCYARRMYKRFKWNPEIEWCPRVFRELDKLKSGSRIFVGSTMELFGEWVKEIWLKLIFEEVLLHPSLTFVFLTKQPQNLIRWSPFPDNCWVGVSATDAQSCLSALRGLETIEAKVKFLSLEPLQEYIGGFWLQDWLKSSIVQWVIIGAQTPYSPKTAPKVEWITEIVEAANKEGIPVFLKNNLLELVNYESPNTAFAFNKEGYYRQEFPDG